MHCIIIPPEANVVKYLGKEYLENNYIFVLNGKNLFSTVHENRRGLQTKTLT